MTLASELIVIMTLASELIVTKGPPGEKCPAARCVDAMMTVYPVTFVMMTVYPVTFVMTPSRRSCG